MKKVFLLFFCLLTSSFLLIAQAPQGIPYQAIARNASGAAIANTAVKVRFSIRDSIATGAIKYQETHNPTTSALGLFSVNVGMGTVVSGSFSGINWGRNAKFMQVELNTTGGTTYTDLGTTQMMSVPYALYAGSTSNSVQPNGDYYPASDSILSLVGVAKFPFGSYTIPSKETWKIVSITIPARSSLDSVKVYLYNCEQYNPTSATCFYLGDPGIYMLQVGQFKYGQFPFYSQESRVTSTCSVCPSFVKVPVFGSSVLDIQMPIWANGGEQLSVGQNFVVYVEKYR